MFNLLTFMSPVLTLGPAMFILVVLLLRQVKKNLSVKARARRLAKA